MTRPAKTLAHILAAAVEITALTALTCVWLTIATLADVEPEVDLDPEPEDFPIDWPEIRRAPIGVVGVDIADVEALRAAHDVVGLVVR